MWDWGTWLMGLREAHCFGIFSTWPLLQQAFGTRSAVGPRGWDGGSRLAEQKEAKAKVLMVATLGRWKPQRRGERRGGHGGSYMDLPRWAQHSGSLGVWVLLDTAAQDQDGRPKTGMSYTRACPSLADGCRGKISSRDMFYGTIE